MDKHDSDHLSADVSGNVQVCTYKSFISGGDFGCLLNQVSDLRFGRKTQTPSLEFTCLLGQMLTSTLPFSP